MAGNRAEIRSHIRSISKTRKITDAMQLISGVMLNREREHLRRVGAYSRELRRVVRDAMGGVEDVEHPYLRRPEDLGGVPVTHESGSPVRSEGAPLAPDFHSQDRSEVVTPTLGSDSVVRSEGAPLPPEFQRGELNEAPLMENGSQRGTLGATGYSSTSAGGKHYVLYIGSDLGMCGSYNANLTRMLQARVPLDAELHVLGTNQYRIIAEEGYRIANPPITSADLEPEDLRQLADDALARFAAGEIDSVDVLYTRFVNAVTFEPELMHLLPLAGGEDQDNVAAQPAADEDEGIPEPPSYVYLEPDPTALVERLVQMMVRSSFDCAFAEARTSEQASRQMAMKSATDNANELLDKLTLQYNQARQSEITQEITEIVSGADAK